MRRPTARPRANRPGMTMIELLVVIVIIALLAALLLPAITMAMRTAKNAAVTAELNAIAQALADFKNKFGDYPPSRILLCENGLWDTTSTAANSTFLDGTGSEADITYAQLAQRSVSYMRKFWPRVATSTTGVVYTTSSGWLDFNGNAGSVTSPESPYILRGHEALVFFLGGVPTTGGVNGFAKNPSNPFQSDSIAPNRMPSFYEFNAGRLQLDGTIPVGTSNASGIPGYIDSLGTNRFIAYFSAYGGNAYDPNDVNFDQTTGTGGGLVTPVESDSNALSPLTLAFQVKFPVDANSANGKSGFIAVSAPPNPYTSTSSVGSVSYQKPNTFQLISAGADGEYGVGGYYNSSSSAPLGLDTGTYAGSPNTGGGVYNSTDSGVRNSERDNLTNFANGRLD